MNCKQAEELLPLYAGRELEQKHATLVTQHVQKCVACARVADEYRESVQLTEQFAPPVFSEAVYAGMRQRVLREIETETIPPSWSQTIASRFRPRLSWAIASALLIFVSLFAIYFIINKGNVEQQLADMPSDKIQPGTKDPFNSVPQGAERSDLLPSLKTDGKEQQLANVPPPQRKRSRKPLVDRSNTVDVKSRKTMSTATNVSAEPNSLSEPTLFPPRDSAALRKTLRVEIQTKDPKIRIVWFVQPETKPAIPSSKGT